MKIQNDDCYGKRFEYHLIISLWDSKKLKFIESGLILKYILKNNLKSLYQDDNEVFDHSHAVLGNNIILACSGKWLKYEAVEQMAITISNKFHCDISMLMTDDDGCARGSFLEGFINTDAKSIRELCND